MAKKAHYEWGCSDGAPDEWACVVPFHTEDEARRHVAGCGGVLVVRRADKDQDWDEVHDELP